MLSPAQVQGVSQPTLLRDPSNSGTLATALTRMVRPCPTLPYSALHYVLLVLLLPWLP